ncbi:MAG: hypothetical protein AB7F86_09680 [Bdellovibrionales bacterium]
MHNGQFKKGEPRPPNAGRRAGVPNKRNKAVRDLIEESGKNPIATMLDLLDHPEVGIRFQAAKELASYMYAKPRTLEVDATVDTNATQVSAVSLTIDQATVMALLARGDDTTTFGEMRSLLEKMGAFKDKVTPKEIS